MQFTYALLKVDVKLEKVINHNYDKDYSLHLWQTFSLLLLDLREV